MLVNTHTDPPTPSILLNPNPPLMAPFSAHLWKEGCQVHPLLVGEGGQGILHAIVGVVKENLGARGVQLLVLGSIVTLANRLDDECLVYPLAGCDMPCGAGHTRAETATSLTCD